MTFTPTPEQTAIVSAGTSSRRNLLVSALAGAAKTSTLVLLAETLTSETILCLAFNKRIAEEMKERLPDNCTSMTLSSLGYRSWRSFISGRITVQSGKTYFMLKDWATANLEDADEITEFWESYEDISRAIATAKSIGYIPEAFAHPLFRSLRTDEEFLDSIEFIPNEIQTACIREILIDTIKRGMRGFIDYDDMLYLPTLCRSCTFPQFATVMIDEAQDLSPLNHHMLSRIVRRNAKDTGVVTNSRLIAVGDHCQSIYGFRGAAHDSMESMAPYFSMDEYALTTSFRCPKAVVREAQWRAPAMQYPAWAIEGEVKSLVSWDATSLATSPVILCRNNAPLISLAFKFIRDGRYPQIVGNDLAASFQKILKKLGGAHMTQGEALASVELWYIAAEKKTKNLARINDIKACLLVFLEDAETLGDAQARVETIFNSSGPIKLMTGHKSKGLEFPHIYILDQHLIRMSVDGEPNLQERNLMYVMQTRAQETLTYITSDGWPTEEAS